MSEANNQTANDAAADGMKFLKTAGKFAAVVPPTMVFLLSTTMHSSALADSGGGELNNGGSGGGTDVVPLVLAALPAVHSIGGAALPAVFPIAAAAPVGGGVPMAAMVPAAAGPLAAAPGGVLGDRDTPEEVGGPAGEGSPIERAGERG